MGQPQPLASKGEILLESTQHWQTASAPSITYCRTHEQTNIKVGNKLLRSIGGKRRGRTVFRFGSKGETVVRIQKVYSERVDVDHHNGVAVAAEGVLQWLLIVSSQLHEEHKTIVLGHSLVYADNGWLCRHMCRRGFKYSPPPSPIHTHTLSSPTHLE